MSTEDSASVGELDHPTGLAQLFKTRKSALNVTGREVNNSFVEEDEEYILDSPKVKAALIAVYTIVFLFCFCGNTIVLLVIKLHWRMQSITKFCLGNLAFSNLCVGLFCVYQNLSLYLIESWIFGKFLCKMYHFVSTLSHTASILIMVVVTVERYLVILHPFKCRSMLTKLRLRLVILGVWILSAIISSPRIYFIKLIPITVNWKNGKAHNEVLCSLGPSVYTSKSSEMAQFLSLFCLPLLIMTVLYAKIIFHLWKRHSLSTLRTPTASFPACDNEASNTQIEVSLVELPNTSSIRKPGKRLSSEARASKVEESKALSSEVPEERNPIHGAIGAEGNSASKKCTDTENPESRNSPLKTKRESRRRKRARGKRLARPRQGSQGSTTIRINFSNRNAQNASINSGSQAVTPSQRTQKHVVAILVLSVGTFAACNLPFHLRKLYKNYFHAPENESDFTELATPLSFLLMYTNCAINPFLYAFMSTSFRSSFQDLLRCKLKRPVQNQC